MLTMPTAESKQGSLPLRQLLKVQKAAFAAEGRVSAATRIDRLNRLIALTADNGERILDAICADYGGERSRHTTVLTEILSKVQGMEHARDHLEGWMQPERRASNPQFEALGAVSTVMFQPKGVVGIISPWNVPFGITVAPLTFAIAAGNRAMIKPSEHTPRTSELLVEIFPKYFAQEEIAVVVGGAEVGAAFSALPFDHLLFTGSTAVGRHIMQSAAENLVPITLELGGKSPVIVGISADMQKTAATLAFGKLLNGGQLCLAPDYVLVPRSAEEGLVAGIVSEARSMYPSVRDNVDVTAIVNDVHRSRLLAHIEDAREKGAKITVVGDWDGLSSSRSRRLPLHIIQAATREMTVMQEEIFGPLLPVVTYDQISEATRYVAEGTKPLGLYYFGSDAAEEAYVLDHTQSGGVTVNDILMHYAQEDLPFGGIGASGMGAYHGRDGFLTFSHARAVYHQSKQTMADALRPPFSSGLLEHFLSDLRRRSSRPRAS
ncbi:coniferyl aldehyde dehydrogenase [Bradyrhizobium sp. USDA 4486]